MSKYSIDLICMLSLQASENLWQERCSRTTMLFQADIKCPLNGNGVLRRKYSLRRPPFLPPPSSSYQEFSNILNLCALSVIPWTSCLSFADICQPENTLANFPDVSGRLPYNRQFSGHINPWSSSFLSIRPVRSFQQVLKAPS